MKSLLLLPLLALGVHAGPYYTQCYSSIGSIGYGYYFINYVPDLYDYSFDNDIESVLQTGMWVYYENTYYNSFSDRLVYFVHGINIAVDFPYEYQNVISSLRYVGSPSTMNADSITFYDGTLFTADEFYTEGDNYVIPLGVSSMIVTGVTPWTVYSGEGYTGASLCLHSTNHDVGTNGETLDLGIFPSLQSMGLADNSLRSVRKGCWSEREAKAPELKVDGRQDNGAWGRLQ